ncbi:MAG TPA: phosphotransferase family protein [Pseudonocardia sp.]|jgi:aminoglycoside phosphotransferase (APT) family kinase protein
MAVQNRLDAEATAAALRTWLAARLPDSRDVQVSDVQVPATSGMSYLSVLFTARWRDPHEGDPDRQRVERLVVRLQPPSGGVFPRYDLAAEFQIMRALADRPGAPVPEARWLETDPAVLGGPFLVMSHVAGRVPPDDPPYSHTGWVLDLGEGGQRLLYDNGLRALAAVAGAEVDSSALPAFTDPPTGEFPSKHTPGLDRQLAYYQHLYEWSFPGGHPTLEAGLSWALEHRPDEGPLRVSWGDSRIGNMIFADDLSVAAVLDWELATLADPELDLGWWLFTLRMNSEGVGAPPPPGFPGRTATAERFEELSGHRVRHLDYYEAFAALRASIIIGRIGNMMIDAGFLPADSPMPISNPASTILADLLVLPPPAATMADWVGKR